jgi:RHS repeat-associated protein
MRLPVDHHATGEEVAIVSRHCRGSRRTNPRSSRTSAHGKVWVSAPLRSLLLVAAAFFIPLSLAESASATALPATIAENTTLTPSGNPYTGSSTIAAGVTLKVEPGVKFQVEGLTVKGTLDVNGTAEKPVAFTGSKSEKAGEWGCLYFNAGSSASVIDHAELAYGGTCGGGMIWVQGGSSPTIIDSTIRKSSSSGIYVESGGSPVIANDNVLANTNYGVYYTATSSQIGEVNIHDNFVEGGKDGIYVNITSSGSVPGKALGANTVVKTTGTALYYKGQDVPNNISGNTLSENAENVIKVREGKVATSSTWNKGSPVKLEGNLTVASGVTLTIDKGVRLINPDITVKGTLNVKGTAGEPVIFTGAKEASAGEWNRVSFEPGSGASVIDHAEFKCGGSGGVGMIWVNGSSPRITNSLVYKSASAGINIDIGGGPEIANNIVIASATYGIRYLAASNQAGEVNIHDNFVEGGTHGIYVKITSSGSVPGKALGGNVVARTTNTALFYEGRHIPGDITGNTLLENSADVIKLGEGIVATSSTWNDGGNPVKVEGNITVASGMTLKITKGVLLKGSPGMTIKGTLKVEGTAEDPVVFTGSKEEKAGEWGHLRFESGSSASVIDHAELAYGGSSGIGIVYFAEGSSPTITNSTIRKSSSSGIYVEGSGAPKIEWNRFRGNSKGITKTGGSEVVARNNDWGCASGPSPAGCGDSVVGNVKWQPATQLPEQEGHCRGDDSQCGEGADPVSLATGQLAYSHRDLLLTNKGKLPLELSRSYSSGSATDTGFGPGWSQTGLASATELESGAVLIQRQDGRQDLFYKVGEAYKAPSGVTGALAKVEGTFQLTTLENAVYRFDSSGRIASITDDHGLKTTYGYDGNGRLATITDPSGQTLTFSYNSSNHITLVKDSTGREVKFAYSAAGDLETVTDALGGITKYAYDLQHRITSITDPRGNVILKNTYDSQGRIVEQRDGLENLWKLEYKIGETVVTEPQGGKLAYGFDGQNRVISETDQVGKQTATSYDGAGNVNEVIRPGGAKWIFGHDSAGNLTSVRDPAGGERKYEFDAKNRLIKYTDARANAWGYEWSAANDLTKITDPEGGETTLTYNESGQPLTISDTNKHKTEFSYDTRGNRLSLADPLAHKWSFGYDTRNYLTSITRPGLKAEALERNALGDLLARTTPEGHKTKYAYDANGLPTQVTDPAEGVWKIAYNAMERPITYTDPLGQEAKITYNGNLRPTKVTNRRGKETTFAYDLANRMTELHAPEGGNWSVGYDARGNRTSVTDPREGKTTYEYDLLDRMTTAKEPLSVTSEYGYDANGNLTSIKDPRGNTTAYGYDKLGRLIEVKQPLEKTTDFAYDGVGNMLSRATAAGTVEYGFDAADRLTSITSGESTLRSYGYDGANRLTEATEAEGHKIAIGYTEEGRPSSISDGRGQSLTRSYDPRGLLSKQVDGRGTLEYGYDKLGRMTSLTDPQGKTLGFGYDAESALTEVTRPNGVTTTNVYNDAGRLAETSSKTTEPLAVLESLKYGYDAAGNVTSRVDQRVEAETSYAYDALNRLTEFNLPGEGSTTYGYDAAGNRTAAGGVSYSFNALNQLTEDSTGTTYSYDGDGRLTGEVNSSEETMFAWDPLDHLAKAETSGGTVTYAFDALERLSERKEGEATQVSHYGDLGDMPTYVADGEGKPTASYVQGGSGLIEQSSEEVTRFPLVDGHGDVTAVVSGAGEVASRQSFDPWGKQLSGTSLEMGYLGAWERPTDQTSGLIQMGARSYSPAQGSFLSEDPILGHLGIGISVNRYPYAWNNPVNRFDLNGRDVLPGLPICLLACSPPAQEYGSDRAKDFVKLLKKVVPDVSWKGPCEKIFTDAGPAETCDGEGINGELEYLDDEPPPTYVPGVDPPGVPGFTVPVPGPLRTPAPALPFIP